MRAKPDWLRLVDPRHVAAEQPGQHQEHYHVEGDLQPAVGGHKEALRRQPCEPQAAGVDLLMHVQGGGRQ